MEQETSLNLTTEKIKSLERDLKIPTPLINDLRLAGIRRWIEAEHNKRCGDEQARVKFDCLFDKYYHLAMDAPVITRGDLFMGDIIEDSDPSSPGSTAVGLWELQITNYYLKTRDKLGNSEQEPLLRLEEMRRDYSNTSSCDFFSPVTYLSYTGFAVQSILYEHMRSKGSNDPRFLTQKECTKLNMLVRKDAIPALIPVLLLLDENGDPTNDIDGPYHLCPAVLRIWHASDVFGSPDPNSFKSKRLPPELWTQLIEGAKNYQAINLYDLAGIEDDEDDVCRVAQWMVDCVVIMHSKAGYDHLPQERAAAIDMVAARLASMWSFNTPLHKTAFTPKAPPASLIVPQESALLIANAHNLANFAIAFAQNTIPAFHEGLVQARQKLLSDNEYHPRSIESFSINEVLQRLCSAVVTAVNKKEDMGNQERISTVSALHGIIDDFNTKNIRDNLLSAWHELLRQKETPEEVQLDIADNLLTINRCAGLAEKRKKEITNLKKEGVDALIKQHKDVDSKELNTWFTDQMEIYSSKAKLCKDIEEVRALEKELFLFIAPFDTEEFDRGEWASHVIEHIKSLQAEMTLDC